MISKRFSGSMKGKISYTSIKARAGFPPGSLRRLWRRQMNAAWSMWGSLLRYHVSVKGARPGGDGRPWMCRYRLFAVLLSTPVNWRTRPALAPNWIKRMASTVAMDFCHAGSSASDPSGGLLATVQDGTVFRKLVMITAWRLDGPCLGKQPGMLQNCLKLARTSLGQRAQQSAHNDLEVPLRNRTNRL